jgi:hypothetical protein
MFQTEGDERLPTPALADPPPQTQQFSTFGSKEDMDPPGIRKFADSESGVVGAGSKRHSLLYIKKSIADASRLFEVETGYWKLSRSSISLGTNSDLSPCRHNH